MRLPGSVSRTDVVLLTAAYGGGHLQACRALASGLLALDAGLHVETLDFVKMVNPLLDTCTRAAYLAMIKRAPGLYGRFYNRTSDILVDSLWQQRLNRLGLAKLARYLQARQPRVVVSAFPTPSGVVAELKRRGLYHGPLVTVITDYVAHSQWRHPGTDLYLVASESVRSGLVRRGVSPGRVAVTGIPINPAFSTAKDRRALRREYGLAEELPTVLLMCGALGMLGGVKEICARLANFPLPIQVVVIAGQDRRLQERLEVMAAGSANPMRVYGYVEDMPSWMAAADVLISKAGGLTVSEALASELPTLIYRPIPGQEEANTHFLVRAGAAVAVDDLAELSMWLEQVICHPGWLERMRLAARRVKTPLAAFTAAEVIRQKYLEEFAFAETYWRDTPGSGDSA